jgi:subfamily B ATP-binding cassette protein MsbA
MSLALAGISLVIPEGKKVALVGFSGAGKSTMVDLIPRFIDPSKGGVFLGGVDLRELSLSGLRGRMAMVGQHTFLFNDTIYNNIAYGNPSATRAEVEAAAKAAFAYDFIMQLPSGFESLVGEGGMTLSGGERQRLAIARAILKNAPILILDEATASLDNRAEREVQSAIQALEQGRTTGVIAHRLSTVQDADLIVVMSKGQIVEQGTHVQLLEKGGEYSRLHSQQFRESEEARVAASVV